jgi:hypothetical protein
VGYVFKCSMCLELCTFYSVRSKLTLQANNVSIYFCDIDLCILLMLYHDMYAYGVFSSVSFSLLFLAGCLLLVCFNSCSAEEIFAFQRLVQWQVLITNGVEWHGWFHLNHGRKKSCWGMFPGLPNEPLLSLLIQLNLQQTTVYCLIFRMRVLLFGDRLKLPKKKCSN